MTEELPVCRFCGSEPLIDFELETELVTHRLEGCFLSSLPWITREQWRELMEPVSAEPEAWKVVNPDDGENQVFNDKASAEYVHLGRLTNKLESKIVPLYAKTQPPGGE